MDIRQKGIILSLFLIVFFMCVFAPVRGFAEKAELREGEVLVITVNGIIDPVSAEFIP